MQQEYSLSKLEKLYKKLVSQQPFNNPTDIPETLNHMGKIIVWGERQNNGLENGDIFDFICQVKLFDLLLQVFTKCKDVESINSVIGFFNMLLTNLNKTETVLYMLSHPCILSMELTKFGTMANELAEYYINFLKGLSRKIDLNTIHIFFNKRYPNFPILYQTIRFYNHPESLVRTTCRNIILSVFQFSLRRHQPNVDEIGLRKLNNIHRYLTDFPFCTYYIHECNFMKEYWKIIDNILEPEGGKESIYENQDYELESLDEVVSDHEELLIFLDDLLSDNSSKQNKGQSDSTANRTIEELFTSAFANQCLSHLLSSLFSINKAFLGIKTALFVFILLLDTVRNKFLTEAIVFALFSKYYPKKIALKLHNPTSTILSYNKQWKFKGFWDGHQNKVNGYCSTQFYQQKAVKSDISLSKVSQTESKSISKISSLKSSVASEAMSVFGVPNYYERQVEKVEQIFGLAILTNDEEQNENIAPKDTLEAFSSLLKGHLRESENDWGQKNLNDYEQNPACVNILAFIESKDDTLVMLTLCLLEKIVTSKVIGENILNLCKLSLQPEAKDFSSFTRIEKIITNCLQIFEVDPPHFRICTYKQAALIVRHFMKIYENEGREVPKEILSQVREAAQTAISRINPYMYGGKQWEKVVEFYLILSRQSRKFRRNTLKSYGIIPQQIYNKKAKSKFVDTVYEEVPQRFDEQIGRDLWIYLIVKELFETIYSKQKAKAEKDTIPVKGTKQNQKSQQIIKYEEGRSYDLGSDECLRAKYKLMQSDRFEDCELILLEGFLVLGSESKVEYKLPYEETYLINDKSDPRKVILQSNSLFINLQFESSKQTLTMKENFVENKNLLLKCHLSNLIKEIEGIESQLL